VLQVRFEAVAETAYPDAVPPDARALIGATLTPTPHERLGGKERGGMATLCEHAFFEGMVGDALYSITPPPLAGGAAAPQPNASWSRRQNSIMCVARLELAWLDLTSLDLAWLGLA
jgi:hypothetical protein